MTAVHESLAAGLAAAGVEVVFGLMGAATDRLTRDLVEVQGLRYIATRHEHSAVAMADGYSRVTGRIGVALISADAGLTNAATALTTARIAGSPILVIVGDQSAAAKSNQTRMDQRPLQSALGYDPIPVSPGTVQFGLQLALRRLDLGHGPAMLNLPVDVANDDDRGSMPAHDLRTHHARPAVAAGADVLDEILGLIALARRPLVLAGRGAFGDDVAGQLIDLAGRIGALTATTLPARGLLNEDPFSLGVCGSFATDAVIEIIGDTDLVLAFGCSLNSHTRGHGALFGKAKVVQIDTDAAVIGRWGPVSHGVVGDAATVAAQLIEASSALGDAELGAFGLQDGGWRTADMEKRIEGLSPWPHAPTARPADGFADPYEVMRACDELLPRRRLVAIDLGYFMSYPAVFLEAGPAPAMVCPWEYGNIGCALGPAIGAAIGRPKLYPVLVIGDGGLAATLSELDTVVRYGIPLLVLVLDDGGFRAERELFRMDGLSSATADSESPNFDGVARMLGFDTHLVRSSEQARTALHSVRTDRPTLIRVMIDPAQPNPEMARAMQGP